MKVKDLRPRNRVDSIELLIVEKGEPRSFTSRDGLTGKVCDARGKDDDGDTVSVTLWNEEIDKVKVNDRIGIANGWVSEWQGNLQLSAGRYGKLEVLE
ncbi:MAG: single-stranded DNA-binding protein [Candidatus Thermoplasmatota archaeon]|nr:single-stranded DNA-binding protein [Candidatus Thermoplasmatota archaeon]